MANPRQRFERFCFKHRNKGIPNLMMFVSLGSALVYLYSMVMNSTLLYDWLGFDCHLILKGQVWRLFTYALTFSSNGLLMTAISLLCYYSLGQAMERVWGTFRFNLYYLTGILLMDAYAMITSMVSPVWSYFMPYVVSVSFLNMSLFLGYATLHPDVHFMLFFIIPIRAWVFALIELLMVVYYMVELPYPLNLMPLVALANYFLFFGKDVLNVLPFSWRQKLRRKLRKQQPNVSRQPRGNTIPFSSGTARGPAPAQTKAPYTHRCTVCGRTDVSHPDLEFRYCSRCRGYHCYCEEHISSHDHVTE